MRCPVCKIDSMRTVPSSAGVEIDRCLSCKSAWFDFGEIRELAEGRFAAGEEPPSGDAPSGRPGERSPARMARAWKEADALSCPGCSSGLSAVDFRMTGIPVFPCRKCGGILVPRRSVADLSSRYRFQREHAALYEVLGESMAGELRKSLERKYGPGAPAQEAGEAKLPGLPVVVPLADAAPSPDRIPLVTWGIIALSLLLYLLAGVGAGGSGGIAARFALPAGKGFSGVPKVALLLAPFFHGGIIPLAAGCLFLFVLGDNVEDRMGRAPFLVFYLLCGVLAGAAHVLWGKAGMPSALGAAGAVAGVLGAYLVFFPEVPISMYGAGEVVSVPAYLFACAWAVAVFLWGWGPGPLSSLLNPAPYSLAGHLAGFTAGMASAALWRSWEGGIGGGTPEIGKS